MRKLTRLSVIALALFGALAPLSASATPSNTRIVEVEECGGTSSSCSTSSPVSDGDLVDFFVQIEANAGSSNATSGFSWLQVQVRRDGESEWTCVRQWALGGATSPAPRSFVWDSTRWPSSASCDLSGQSNVVQSASGRTANGTYEVRARARDTGLGGALGSPSDVFTVRVNNRPSQPAWAAEPRDIGPSKNPAIELRWTGSPEPDVLQYDIVRTGPSGGQVTYNISASSPGQQGCSRASSTNVFTCYDTNFPASGYGGAYSYRVTAFRSSPATAIDCRHGGSCIASQASAPESASVNEPSPSPSPSNGGSPSTSPSSSPSNGGSSGSPSSRPSARSTRNSSGGSRVLGGRTDPSEFFTGTYDESLPYDQRGGFGSLLPGDDTTDGGLPGSPFEGYGSEDSSEIASPGEPSSDDELYRRLLVSIAAGLLMVLVAMHIVRLLYDQ